MSQPAVALAPLPFELVYEDGEPLETEWHTLEYPFLRELIGQAMAEQGRRRAERYSWAATAAATLDVYRELVPVLR